jgi:hypothetical protein
MKLQAKGKLSAEKYRALEQDVACKVIVMFSFMSWYKPDLYFTTS